MEVGGFRHGFYIFLMKRISFLWVGVTEVSGEQVGFDVSGVARVGSSSLVINGLGGVTRSLGILNLEVRGDIDLGGDLREGE